ncbi:MAG: hypothetical protein UU77_C0035G0007 [candidate division WWE3 bacterium GW2011_GWC1_41_7]|uniref:Response regulatory domain-containing protein n=1 Tax=candidate division WWE3 bacterium GW2011_GWC1_41_7 TaxID=1619119 RepID=A0A0G0ZD08_UNCKA|nr:MAG: hypothetical protein UU77_C0035G0007 [candidate division WWE3 bacterium GW2011_GWC1_41_7]
MAKVLIIEDKNNHDVAESLKPYLEHRGHRIEIGFWDGADLVRGLRTDTFVGRHNPEILLIHFGTHNSIKGAKVVLTRLKRIHPKIKIIVVTCIDPEELIEDVSTIEKPFDLDLFLKLLK